MHENENAAPVRAASAPSVLPMDVVFMVPAFLVILVEWLVREIRGIHSLQIKPCKWRRTAVTSDAILLQDGFNVDCGRWNGILSLQRGARKKRRDC